MTKTLIIAEHDGTELNPSTAKCVSCASEIGGDVDVLVLGNGVQDVAAQAAGIDWDESSAHSAEYDTVKTAELFCAIVNRWKILTGL